MKSNNMKTFTTTAAFLLLASLASSLVGCASTKECTDIVYKSRSPGSAVVGNSLAFDPPITAFAPSLDFDRTDRAPTAYVGFDAVTTYSYTRLDDRQSFNQGARGRRGFGDSDSSVDRQSVTSTVAVRVK